MGDNGIVKAIGIGTIEVEVEVKGISKKIILKDMMHVPKMKKNLNLVSKLVTHVCKEQYDMKGWFLRTIECKEVGIGLTIGNVYIIIYKRINCA